MYIVTVTLICSGILDETAVVPGNTPEEASRAAEALVLEWAATKLGMSPEKIKEEKEELISGSYTSGNGKDDLIIYHPKQLSLPAPPPIADKGSASGVQESISYTFGGRDKDGNWVEGPGLYPKLWWPEPGVIHGWLYILNTRPTGMETRHQIAPESLKIQIGDVWYRPEAVGNILKVFKNGTDYYSSNVN